MPLSHVCGAGFQDLIPPSALVVGVGKSLPLKVRNVGAAVPPALLPAKNVFWVTAFSVKLSAGVEAAVATLVVNKGERSPALKVVTVPVPLPPVMVQSVRCNPALSRQLTPVPVRFKVDR